MKKYYLLATALAAMVSCTSDDYVGDNNLQEANGQAAISFNMNTPAVTRATQEDAEAAATLNRQFIVYAEKNESGKDAPAAGNLVFQNYKVAYTASTANTTTSNTDDWEYVGLSWTAAEQGNITTSTIDAQTIKYWDNDATSYTFTAVSALPDDISSGRVKIEKTTSSGTDQYAKGYSITLAKSGTESYTYPSLSNLYFADRNYIAKGEGYSHNAVKMTFRNAQSHVRAGVYETIPGYKISAINFYVNTTGNTPTQTLDAESGGVAAFGAVCPNVSGSNFEGTLTVTYGDGTTGPTNQPIISVSDATSEQNLILGTNMSTLTSTGTAKFLGEAANNPTYDTDGGDYTIVMPQESNTTNLKLKVNYTLYNEITHETINITGKTAEVPGKYLAWKPNYMYTYLFKITDSDLNPITFDAAVIQAEDGKVEYITTVTEPSITTYAKSSNVTADNEYKPGSNIYIVVNKGGSNVALSASNAKLYTVTLVDTDPSDGLTTPNQTITEASVANALETTGSAGVWEVTDANKWKMTVTNITTGDDALSFPDPSKIAAEDAPDGNEITINCAKFSATTTYTAVAEGSTLTADKRYYTHDVGEDKYVEYKVTGSEGTVAADTYYTANLKYYVFEFTDTDDGDKKYYKVIKVQ